MKAVVAPYQERYKDMQKKAKQSKTASFLTKSSVSLSVMYCSLFNHPDIFQPLALQAKARIVPQIGP
jgi:hypothetical protein